MRFWRQQRRLYPPKMEPSAVMNDGVRMPRSDGDALRPATQQPPQLGVAPGGPIATGAAPTARSVKASQAAGAPHGAGGGVTRLRVSVDKKGNKLGFGVRQDRARRLVVSTVVGQSALCEGDTLVSVNGLRLDGLEFLAIVEHLKALPPGSLVFDIERPMVATSQTATKPPGRSGASPIPSVPSSTSVTNSGAAPRPMPESMVNGVHATVASAVMSVETLAGSTSAPVGGLVSSASPTMTNASGDAAPITLSGRTSISTPPPVASRAPLMTGQPPVKKPRL